jgi:rRNA processing protein Gar1
MENFKPMVPNMRIVEDESSGESLSDNEDRIMITEIDHMGGSEDERKPQVIAPSILDKPETLEERLARFGVSVADLFNNANKVKIGNVEKCGTRMILIKPESGLLNIGNILYVATLDRMEIIGAIDDVVGSIETPVYVVEKDHYFKTNNLESIIVNAAVYADRDKLKLITGADIYAMQQEKGIDNEFESQKGHGDEDLIFSDDEAEIEYYRNKNQNKKMNQKRDRMDSKAEKELEECKYDRIPSIFMGSKKIKPM